MSTDKSAAAAREFCQEWCGLWDKTNSYLKPGANFPINHMISDLTALIEEHYVSKDKYMDDLVDEYERGFRDGRGDVNNNDR